MLAVEAVKSVGTLEFTWPLRVTSWAGNYCTQQQVRGGGDRELNDEILAVLFMSEVRV